MSVCLLIGLMTTGCALLPAATPRDAAALAEVDELKPADLQLPGRQLLVGKQLRGVALQPFVPVQSAYDSVRRQALGDGAHAMVVTWSGQRQEDNGGIGGVYFVVEAVSVARIPFTAELGSGVIGTLEQRHPLEVESALLNLRSSKPSQANEVLLTRLKFGQPARYMAALTETYALINGAAAVPELLKLLRYHPNDAVRIEAGRQLLPLGQRMAVDAATTTERSTRVQAELRRLLLL